VRHLGEALRGHVASGALRLSDDAFWAMAHVPLWEMPLHLEEQLRGSKMVLVRGDANFVRLMGERQWPMWSDLMRDAEAAVLGAWPVPVCASLVSRSGVAGLVGVGVPDAARRRLDTGGSWATAGRVGIVVVGDGQ
jgi:hypothetical protein